MMMMMTLTKTKGCIYCDTPVDSDIWEEELGMCIDCSNKYWNHELDFIDESETVGEGKDV